MPDGLSAHTLAALHRALGGVYRMPVSDDVVILYTPLPGECLAAAVQVSGVLWVVVDLDKPRAIRHARAMIEDYRESKAGGVDLGDDDLNREWQRGFGMPPLVVDAPLPVKAAG